MKRGLRKLTNFLKKYWIIISIVILFIAWFSYSYFSGGIISSLVNSDTNSVVDFINSSGFFAGIVFMFLVILEVVLAPMPPLVLYLAAGYIFGGFIGGIYTLAGNITGALIDFKLARKFGKNTINKTSTQNFQKKFHKFSEKYGTYAIFILRVNPLTTSDIVSYLSGFTKIKTWKFLLATALGLIPMIFVQTYFGDIFIRDNPFLSALVLLFSITYLGIFVYLVIKTVSHKPQFSSKNSKTLKSGLKSSTLSSGKRKPL